MNWLYKIANHHWWNLNDPLLTLYHATYESALRSIMNDGIKPLNTENTINRIIESSGLSINQVPREIFTETKQCRNDSWVYWSCSMQTALGYASYVGCGGEFAMDIKRRLFIWAEENNIQIKPNIQEPTYIIKADIPRELVFKSNLPVNQYLTTVFNNLKKSGLFEEKDDVLMTIQFLTKDIDKKYIKEIIRQ